MGYWHWRTGAGAMDNGGAPEDGRGQDEYNTSNREYRNRFVVLEHHSNSYII